MCTVTFLPDPDGRGYLLAHNRDEEWKRGPEHPPRTFEIGDRRVVTPEDSDAGGTWIGLDDRGWTLCILNGSGARRRSDLSLAVSRGTLVRELLADAHREVVADALKRRLERRDMPFQPFRLLAVSGEGLTRFAWDGQDLVTDRFEEAWIEVSHGVAEDEARRLRRAAFELCRSTFTSPSRSERFDALQRFHATHGADVPAGDAFSVCLHAERARTMSSILIDVRPEHRRLYYTPGQPCQTGVCTRYDL